jgi:oligo-1,6-glucosidase
MRVNDDYPTVNAQIQTDSSNGSSVFHFWQRALSYRKLNKDTFVYGDFAIVGNPVDDKIIAYKRFSTNNAFVVVLNFSGEQISWNIPSDIQISSWTLGNYTLKDTPAKELLTLRPWEGIVGELVLS